MGSKFAPGHIWVGPGNTPYLISMPEKCNLSIQYLDKKYPDLLPTDKCPFCKDFFIGDHRDETLGKSLFYWPNPSQSMSLCMYVCPIAASSD